MKLAVPFLALFVVSSVLAADDAEIDVPPVTPFTPAQTAPVATVTPAPTTFTVRPLAVELVSALLALNPDPEQIRALVNQLVIGDIAKVVVAIADSPNAVSALVAQLTPEKLVGVSIALANTPSALMAMANQLTTEQASAVITALEKSPSAIFAVSETIKTPSAFCAFIAALKPEQLARIAMALQESPSTLRAVAATLDTEKLKQFRVALFLVDVEAWGKVAGFLEPETSHTSVPGRFGGNWLDAARERLRQKIAREGYTPENLAAAEALMEQTQKPQPPIKGK